MNTNIVRHRACTTRPVLSVLSFAKCTFVFPFGNKYWILSIWTIPLLKVGHRALSLLLTIVIAGFALFDISYHLETLS